MFGIGLALCVVWAVAIDLHDVRRAVSGAR
jgi:hypothetical protein